MGLNTASKFGHSPLPLGTESKLSITGFLYQDYVAIVAIIQPAHDQKPSVQPHFRQAAQYEETWK